MLSGERLRHRPAAETRRHSTERQIKMATEASMREVVARLRAEGSAAMLELLEFDSALEAFLETVEHVAPTIEELDRTTRDVVRLAGEDAPQWSGLSEQTGRLSTWAGQFLAAFRELRRSVRAWNITDPRSSNTPNSGERKFAKD